MNLCQRLKDEDNLRREYDAAFANDPINSPAHYARGPIEPIDFIESLGLGYHEGNIVKYIARWRHKNGVEDLQKARWYIDRLIKIADVAQRPEPSIANAKTRGPTPPIRSTKRRRR